MLLIVLSGFILALLFPLFGKYLKQKASIILTALPLSLFIYFIYKIPAIASQESLFFEYNWVPSLGINLVFNLDGLSLLFALLITGIGALVYFYTSYYLKGHQYLDRFYGYLSVFMASMLGLVLSDNVITLFIFWELTSISSFYLIGFNNESEKSRKSAIIALSITGFGGLFLLAGGILLGGITGTYSLSEMLQSGISLHDHGHYIAIIALIFVAAFTKSAQFPFHFWLPGAMAAPTPVSTYLHSATMVKAGIYLLARFGPLLGDHQYWNTTLLIVGGITMTYAAVHAIFRNDLKGILAYSTISALGVLVFLIGLGTDEALLAAGLFILIHALYKATLFLVAGIIDHETGSRDVTRLAGLRKVMWPVAIAGFLAAVANAGIPPALGFVGKDLIYESTMGFESWAILLTGIAILVNVLLLYAGFQAGIRPFAGQLPEEFKDTHAPSFILWTPPLLLSILGILFGLFPHLVEDSLIRPLHVAMSGGDSGFHLALWHGFNFVLLLSAITVASGVALYFFIKPSISIMQITDRYQIVSPQNILTFLSKKFYDLSLKATSNLQNGRLKNYLLTIFIFVIALIAYKLFSGVSLYIDYSKLSELTIYEVVILIIMTAAIIFTVFTNSRLVAVSSMGIVGYSICLLFVFYSAPDLAMTQFTIDTLTVILFLLVLYRLPKYLNLSDTRDRIRDGVVALSFGALITILTLEVLNEPLRKATSQYYAENAYVLAKGKNVVNVILVDFRGLDTLVEITVLVIAALGVYSLLKLNLNKSQTD
ncbi:MAG: putative monovalent cation/H+ antiporter subunit A [Cyclobacteriaceae bacterium]